MGVDFSLSIQIGDMRASRRDRSGGLVKVQE